MPVRHAEWRVRSSQGIKFSSYKRRRGTWALARNGLRNHGGVFARTVRVHGSCPTVVLEQHVVGIASERDRSPRDLSSPPETQGGLGGHVFLRNVLPASGYRLRATSKTGEITGHRSVLPSLRGALAEPCRARTRTKGRRRWSGEQGERHVEAFWCARHTSHHTSTPQQAI
jgi:hypothetical protein